MSGEGYLIEFVRVGNQVKVSACDPESGMEASIIGPVTASQRELSTLAIRKLKYVIGKNNSSGD